MGNGVVYIIGRIKDLETSKAYLEARVPHTNVLFYGGGAALVIGSIMPSLVLPLLFKNGQSLGKYMTGLALVDKQGYRVKSWQVVLRFIVLSIVELGASIRLYVIPPIFNECRSDDHWGW